MNQSGLRTCALTLLVVLSTSAGAEELSLSDCLARARSRSVQSIQALLAEGRAKAALRETDTVKRPQLMVKGALSRSDDPATQYPDANNGTLRLEQSLDPFSSNWVLAEQRAAQARAASLSRVETAQDVDLQVRRLYFSILEDQDAVASIQKVSDELVKLLETVMPKFVVGRAPAFDPVKVRLAIADLSRSRALTQARLGGERETLALIAGLADASGLTLAPVSTQPALPDGDFADLAMQGDPTLRSLGEETRVAALGVTVAGRARWPDLVGGLEYGYAAQTTSGMTRGWAATLDLRMPLYDWGRISAQVAQQEFSVRQAENQKEARRREILARIVQTLGETKTHAQDQRTLAALLPDIRQAALVQVKRYRLGAAGILEATDAMSLWLNTLLQERAAYYAYLSDLAGLERLTGGRFKAAYDR